MKPFDLSKFKKTKEDHDTATLRHPDGHEIRIAKRVLSKPMLDQLSKLPSFKSGQGEDNGQPYAMAKGGKVPRHRMAAGGDPNGSRNMEQVDPPMSGPEMSPVDALAGGAAGMALGPEASTGIGAAEEALQAPRPGEKPVFNDMDKAWFARRDRELRAMRDQHDAFRQSKDVMNQGVDAANDLWNHAMNNGVKGEWGPMQQRRWEVLEDRFLQHRDNPQLRPYDAKYLDQLHQMALDALPPVPKARGGMVRGRRRMDDGGTAEPTPDQTHQAEIENDWMDAEMGDKAGDRAGIGGNVGRPRNRNWETMAAARGGMADGGPSCGSVNDMTGRNMEDVDPPMREGIPIWDTSKGSGSGYPPAPKPKPKPKRMAGGGDTAPDFSQNVTQGFDPSQPWTAPAGRPAGFSATDADVEAPLPTTGTISAPGASPMPLTNPSIMSGAMKQGQGGPSMADPLNQQINELQHGFSTEQQGIQNEANVQGWLGKQEAGAAALHQSQVLGLKQHQEDEYNKLNGQIGAAIKDVNDGHIDPNHWMNSKSDFGKASTAVGMILGGLGSGLQGGPNQALEFIKSQIDKDVYAQRVNLGQKENVLNAYFKQMGNLSDATAMTYGFYNDLYSNEIAKQAALSKSPGAQARAQQAIGALQQRKAQVIGPLSVQRGIWNYFQSQGGSANPDAAAMGIRLMVPPNQQEQAYKELQAAQNHVAQSKNIMDNFDQVDQENGIGGRVGRLGYNPPSVYAYRNNMMPFLKDAEGRINDSELERTDELIPKPFDTKDTVAGKRVALQQFLNEKSARPMLGGNFIPTPKAPNTKQNFKTRPGYTR